MSGGKRDPLDGLAEYEFVVLPGALKQNRAALLQVNNDFVEYAKLPVEEQTARLKYQFGNSAELPWLARVLASAGYHVADAHHRNQAILRCAIALVASERYRRTQNRWPTTVNDLVPTHLAKVPIDPYDGASLRLRPFAEGMIIYSVGADGQDDGGNLDERPNQSGTDLGFHLWDTAKRRQPARPWPKKGQD
jgi:hypothetical protein